MGDGRRGLGENIWWEMGEGDGRRYSLSILSILSQCLAMNPPHVICNLLVDANCTIHCSIRRLLVAPSRDDLKRNKTRSEKLSWEVRFSPRRQVTRWLSLTDALRSNLRCAMTLYICNGYCEYKWRLEVHRKSA